ncbi:MAG: hypothetical protein MUF61_01860, partial [archaeon]|nr:hypothetical protein [archaeon]
MVSKRIVLVLSLILAVSVVASFASAAAVINWVNITDKDNFYSNYAGNNIIHVVANVSGISPTGAVTANFSGFEGTIDCGGGSDVITMTNTTGATIFSGVCDVGAEAALSDFEPIAPILISAYNETPPVGPPAMDTTLNAVLYNMTVPQMLPGCQRFGPLTTNFTNISDFQRVNFVIHVQNNFTCMIQQLGQQGPPSLSLNYLNILVLNFTSVNLSTQEQAEKLSQLPTYLNITIPQPKTFGTTRIWVNGTGFASLNSNASISLLNLPFTAKPNISSDNISELFSSSWVSNGYDSGFAIVTGNLTINVLGFTEFVPDDDDAPTVSIVPINSTSQTVLVNITVNGTGSEPSYINFSFAGVDSAWIYNETYNSANCTRISTNNETFNCLYRYTFGAGSQGTFAIYSSARDYGGSSPGNLGSDIESVKLDWTGPSITVATPSEYSNRTTNIVFNITASDAVAGLGHCWMNLNGNAASNKSMAKSGDYYNYTNASLTAGNYLARFYCNDSWGNVNNASLNFTIDTTAPVLNSISESPSTTSASITYAASEDVNISVIYGTESDDLDDDAASGSYSSGTSISLSGLTASETYYYNTTICDRAGNCASNGTFDFTTDEEDDDSGGGGGSESGGVYWAVTYSISNASEMEAGFVKALGLKQRVRFKV